MLKFILSVLFVSTLAFAVSDDAACVEFCNKCAEEQSALCQEITETCQCNVSNVTEEQPIVETPTPSEPVQETQSKPIMKATFAPPQEEKKDNNGAIMNVNFGYKGDSEYTATLQADGSYENEKKGNPFLWIAIGVATVVTIIIIAASN
jgi:hypothetical protein